MGIIRRSYMLITFFPFPASFLWVMFPFFFIFCALKVNFFPIDSYGCFYEFY